MQAALRERPSGKMPEYTVGSSFLVWLPNEQTFAEWFLPVGVSRNEARERIGQRLGEPCVAFAKMVARRMPHREFVFYVPDVRRCHTFMVPPPDETPDFSEACCE